MEGSVQGPHLNRSRLARLPLSGDLHLPPRTGGHQGMLSREESWQNVEPASARTAPGSVANTSFSFNSQTLDELFPLKTVADRISLEVEQFAEKVDDWAMKLEHTVNTEDDDKLETATRELAMNLLTNFRAIAEDELHSLKQNTKSERNHLSRTWRRRVNDVVGSREASVITESAAGDESQESSPELWQAEEELNLWDLLKSILDLRHPTPAVKNSKNAFIEARGPITSSTPATEIFERFVLLDDSAREKKIILEWLEDCAQHGGSDLEMVSRKLEEKAGINKGTWSRGWMETRETLKAAKRFGAKRLDKIPNPPKQQYLVSRLDPDVIAREGASLKAQDDFLERSLWLTCFAMMRQGRSWREIREWFEDRNEGWRIVSIGCTGDESDSRLYVNDQYAGSLFRRMCFAAAQNDTASNYERAVYALLAGDAATVEPVCQTWDDHLYAQYTALLVSSFEKYLQANCPGRLPTGVAHFPMPAALEARSNADIIDLLSNKPISSSKTAMKRLQSEVIADTFGQFIIQLGIAMANYANPKPDQEASHLIRPTNRLPDESFWNMIEDYNTVRVIVHVLIIWEAMGGRIGADDAETQYHVESVFVFYANFLRIIGKTEAIPTYANFIAKGRSELVVGYLLADIIDRQEQKEIVELMASNTFNTPLMIHYQIECTMAKARLDFGYFEPIENFDILEPAAGPRWPGQRVRKGFGPSQPSDSEEAVLRACEWYNYVKSTWKETFETLTRVMKAFLLSGHWSAALELTKRLPFHHLSVAKSGMYFEPETSLDVFSPDDEEILLEMEVVQPPEATPEPAHAYSLRRSTRGAASRAASEQPAPQRVDKATRDKEIRLRKMTLQVLRAQSRQYLELQQLTLLLERLSHWRLIEDATSPTAPDKTHKQSLAAELSELDAAMEPLLAGDFMSKVLNEDDQADLSAILRVYFPPILLSYISATVHASTHLGPQTLLPALTLANSLASEPTPANPSAPDNSHLAAALVAAGRMRDVVEALALASRTLLRLNEEVEILERRAADAKSDAEPARRRRSRKQDLRRKRGWMGETVDIWDPNRAS